VYIKDCQKFVEHLALVDAHRVSSDLGDVARTSSGYSVIPKSLYPGYLRDVFYGPYMGSKIDNEEKGINNGFQGFVDGVTVKGYKWSEAQRGDAIFFNRVIFKDDNDGIKRYNHHADYIIANDNDELVTIFVYSESYEARPMFGIFDSRSNYLNQHLETGDEDSYYKVVVLKALFAPIVREVPSEGEAAPTPKELFTNESGGKTASGTKITVADLVVGSPQKEREKADELTFRALKCFHYSDAEL